LKTPAVYPQITQIAQIEERPPLNKSVKSDFGELVEPRNLWIISQTHAQNLRR
jgi:hypothetical protein